MIEISQTIGECHFCPKKAEIVITKRSFAYFSQWFLCKECARKFHQVRDSLKY